MAIPFATDEWIKALQVELNNSEKYAKAAAAWEGDFYFIVDKGSADGDVYLYLDLWHGKANDAFAVSDSSKKSPAFELRAPVKTWKGVLSKKIDPIRGIMTRQLKLKGNMMKVMKAPKAAIQLVECASALDTEWSE